MPTTQTQVKFPDSMSFTTELKATKWIQSNVLINFPCKGRTTPFCFGDNNSDTSKNMHAYLLIPKQRTLVVKLEDKDAEVKYNSITNELISSIISRKHYDTIKYPTEKQVESIIATSNPTKPLLVIANYSPKAVELAHFINEAEEDTQIYLILLATDNQDTSKLHSSTELTIGNNCSMLGLSGEPEYAMYFPITVEEDIYFNSMLPRY